MLLNIQHHIEIAVWSAVRAGLAFTGNTQPRTGVYAGRNAQIDNLIALDSTLAPTIRAALFDNLSRTLAGRTCPRDRKKSLLIRQLAAAPAGLARACSGSRFCAGSLARLAGFLFRQLYFCGNARRRLFEGQSHVVAQIGAALSARAATTPTTTAEQIFKSKKVAKNVVEILEHCSIEVH